MLFHHLLVVAWLPLAARALLQLLDADCARQSAAIRNLTVYGTEILYTQGEPLHDSPHADTSTSFEFQLYNAVLDVDAQCSTHVPQARSAAAAEAAAATWHTCFVESRDVRIAAAFRFDLERHELTVNETWVCDDGSDGSGSTTAFQAYATNSIAVLCQESVNQAVGQHYCAAVPDVPLPVNVTVIGTF